MAPNWTHLIRFIAQEDGQVHLGQVDPKQWPDVGLAVLKGETVTAKLVKGSVFDGVVTDKLLHVAQVSDGETPDIRQHSTSSICMHSQRHPQN